MRRGPVLRHAHRGESDRRRRLLWHWQRCFDDHIGRPATTSTGKVLGCQYGSGTTRFGVRTNRGWTVYPIRLMAVVYVLAILSTTPLVMMRLTWGQLLRVGFYINLPIGGVVSILLFFLRIPEPGTKPPARQVLGTAIKSLDLPGFMLISPAAVMFLLGLQYGGNQYAWNSSVVIGLLVGAAVIFALFLVWEYHKGDEAMVPFAMLKNRVIWSAAGNMFFLLSSILVADFYLAIYFQAVHDDPPFMSGVHILPTTIGMVLFTMTSGVMSMSHY